MFRSGDDIIRGWEISFRRGHGRGKVGRRDVVPISVARVLWAAFERVYEFIQSERKREGGF